ncbi:MAG: hypothetical protein DIJKHBIC_01632 [Thermoanaerobaculia bacterium]|nr:hypothetical protein [Thermoanaerobaculia bacterium]
MKKMKALVCAGLLASAGTMLGVTCSVDNVPAATLLVPYFKVAAPVKADFTLDAATVDTNLAITNVSSTGLIAHVTVWNKYSKPVVDYNIALTGYDVATWRMSDVLGGELTPNYSTHQRLAVQNIEFERGLREDEFDPCGVYWPSQGAPTYLPDTGFGKTTYIRFPHPLSADAVANSNSNSDHYRAISIYTARTASRNAYGTVPSTFQKRVLASLDESADYNTLEAPTGAGILDPANWVCSKSTSTRASDDLPAGPAVFTGYVTIDVVNYCTNWFPDQAEYYDFDAIATMGWRQQCTSYSGEGANSACTGIWVNTNYTPNALIGDYFFVDAAAGPAGNISGDPMVALEFDERLDREPNQLSTRPSNPKTFYERYINFKIGATNAEFYGPFGRGVAAVPFHFRFSGDGREPLGERFGFRFMAAAGSLESKLTVWRASVYKDPTVTGRPYTQVDLCSWLRANGASDAGFYDAYHALTVQTFNEDEEVNLSSGQGCPSGDPECQGTSTIPYIFLESQRINIVGARGINPKPFEFGWIDVRMKTLPPPAGRYPYMSNQAYLSIQHSGPGFALSVGHPAHLLDGEFLCRPIGLGVGTLTPARIFNPAGIPNQPWDGADAETRWYPGIQSLQFNRNANTNAPQGTYSYK